MATASLKRKLPDSLQSPHAKPGGGNKLPLVLVLLTASLALGFWAALPDGNDEEYLQELIGRKEKGEILASGEEKDFCELMSILRDSVSIECAGVLDGINWERPPRSPEALGENWEEVTDKREKEKGNRRDFRHKKYPKIIIAFDKGNPDAPFKGPKAHAKKDHWHRYHPNSRSDNDYYLNEKGKPLRKHSDDSHIEIRGL